MRAAVPSGQRAVPTILAAVLALAVVAFATWAGTLQPLFAFGIFVGAALLLLVGPVVPAVLAFYLSLLVAFIDQDSAWRWFDLVFLAIAAAAFVRTRAATDRRAWELHGPGWIVVGLLAAPWIALPAVPEPVRWLAEYKLLLMATGLFLALRRIVPPRRADLLLVAFPLIGLLTWWQLGSRMSGAGGLTTTRVTFRNFYTDVGWGTSNYVAGILVLTLGATTILLMRARAWWIRGLLLVSLLAQLQAFVPLQSRGATVAVLVMLLVLAAHGDLRTRLATVALGAAAVIAMVAGDAGRALISRFSDPVEAGSWLHRVEIWKLGWERFLAHPWSGIGIGQGAFLGDLGGSSKAHNYLLQVLQDQGLPGFAAWVAWTVGVFVLARRARPPVGVSERLYRGVVTGAVAAVLVHALVEPMFGGFEMQMCLAWFLAWLALQDPRALPAEVR